MAQARAAARSHTRRQEQVLLSDSERLVITDTGSSQGEQSFPHPQGGTVSELGQEYRRLCWPLRSSAPHLLSVPHHGTGVIRRSRHGTHAAVSAARADALALLARSSSA